MISFFPYFTLYKKHQMENLGFLAIFFSLHIQNRKYPHKISFVLFMKFPACALVYPDQLASDDAS